MRSAEQIRERLIAHLGHAIRRPAMWVYPARGIEFFLLDTLSNVCFIDEREAELNQALDKMNKQEVSTNTGVFGAFHLSFDYKQFEIDQLYNEVTSIYAELAWNLGYLTVDRNLSKAAMKKLRRGLRAKCKERNWHQSEIKEQYGEPSLKIGDVYCYAPETRSERWVFFDFWKEYNAKRITSRVIVYEKYTEDPILRNVRLPANTLKRGLVFTPFGQQFAG